MSYTKITDSTNNKNDVYSKLEKFENTLNNSLDVIKHNQHVSSEETQLIKLSFETMLSFLTKKSEEL